MAKNKETSAVIDNMLRIVAGGAVIGTGLLAPQTIQLLDKPVHALFDTLDEREKERKLRQTVTYMRQQGLLIGDYEHGLELSRKAQKRLKEIDFDNINITKPKQWDHQWRLVMFDIPEAQRSSRIMFTSKIKSMGFQPLQQSVWIHPYSCKSEIARIAAEYNVTQWITYIETNHIDHEQALLKRFSHVM